MLEDALGPMNRYTTETYTEKGIKAYCIPKWLIAFVLDESDE